MPKKTYSGRGERGAPDARPEDGSVTSTPDVISEGSSSEGLVKRVAQEVRTYKQRIERGEIPADDFEYLIMVAAENIIAQGEAGRPVVEIPTQPAPKEQTSATQPGHLTTEARAAVEARFAEKFLELSLLLKKPTLTPVEENRLRILNRIAQGYDQYLERLAVEDGGRPAGETETTEAEIKVTLELIAESPLTTEELPAQPLRSAPEVRLERTAGVEIAPEVESAAATATSPESTKAATHPPEVLRAEVDTAEAAVVDSGAPPSETGAVEPTHQKPGRRKVGIVDITSKIDEIARHRAEERLQRELHGEGGDQKDPADPWWKKVGQGIARQARKSIRHTGEEYYRQKYIQEETERIREQVQAIQPNAFKPDGTAAEFSGEAHAIIQRFVSEYDGMVRTTEGEKKTVLGEGVEKEALRGLVVRYANGEIDERVFKDERNIVFADLQTAHPDMFEQERATVDNLYDIAKEFRVAAEHGTNIAAIDVQLDIELGQARSAIKDEAHLRSFDRLVKTMQKTPILRNMANPVVMGLAVSLAMAPARSLMNIGSKVSHVATPLAAAGIGAGFAALRRNTELKGDKAHTLRGVTMGHEIPAGSKRLEKLAEFGYDQKEATALSGRIDAAVEQVRNLPPSDPGYQRALEGLMEAIAETDARVEYSDASKHDYIKYSGATKIEQERFSLLKTLAEAKLEFAQRLPKTTPSSATVSMSALEVAKGRTMEALDANVEEQDRAFGKFKNIEVVKAALYGAATGLVVGSLFQFGARKIQEAFDHDAPQSAVAKLWDVMHGRQDMISTTEHPLSVGQHGQVVIPEGWHVTSAPDQENSFSFIDNHGHTHPFEVDPTTGKIQTEQLEELRRAGMAITERDVHELAGGQTTQTAEEFAKSHQAMTNIARGGGPEHAGPHFDQDTPKFDQNELRLDLGGVHNTGITADGKYELDVSRMTAAGSFKGAESVDIKELIASGNAKVLLSLSQETQKMVYEVPIGSDGHVLIDPNSEIGKLLFRTTDGHAEFLGRFAEVARTLHNQDGSLMIDANGDQHVQILATLEGQGIDQVPVTDTVHHVTTLEQPREWEGPWVMPLSRRDPLESFRSRHFRPEYITGSDERRAAWERERSPRLSENPDAQLDMQEETDWYFKEQERRYGPEYIKELDGIIDQSEELRELDPKTEIIVCMPVAAAHEAKNIYSTLELYASQHQDALDKTTILLNLNWIETSGAVDTAQIDTTIREVARARKDFPQLRIAAMTKTWAPEFVKSRSGMIYGEVVKYLNDTALRAIQRSGIDQDIYLLTNDADARGMSSSYLQTFQRDMQEQPGADGFLGKLEWGTESYDKYPGYHVAARVMQILESMYRHGISQSRNIASSGANFLVKAGTYAAVGGYNREMGAGADTDLGRRIKAARFGKRKELNVDQFPIKYTNAAWVDTDPSRALEYYRSGRPIIDMWAGFDEGGYKPRGELVVEGTEEDLQDDYETIVKRIEFQVSALINQWVGYENTETYTNALNLALPPQEGKPLWEIRTHGQDHEVVLTDQGQDWLKQQLTAYRDQGRKETLYRKRGHRAGRVPKDRTGVSPPKK